MIRLTDKEILRVLNDTLGKPEDGDYAMEWGERAIAQAQLKKVVEWLKEKMIFEEMSEEDWQALLKEIRD